jgi:long-chain fatty acid transport protein
MQIRFRFVSLFVAFAVMAMMVCVAHGSGFALVEQSAKHIGHSLAGVAAETDDPSTMFFNPAALAGQEGMQIVAGAHAIIPSFEFSDDGSTPAGGGNGGDAGVSAIVPNLYYAQSLNDNLKLGLGVNVPFGLVTEYDSTWVGRYAAIKTDLQTLNINPALGLKLSEKLYAGLGLNAMYADAELTSAMPTPIGDRKVVMKGDDWGYGYNLGLSYLVQRGTSIGISYRSKVEQELDGSLSYSGLMPAEGVKADLELPASAWVGVRHAIGDWAAVMLGASWTEWSSFEELAVRNDAGELKSYTDESWEDTMRYSAGFNYYLDPKWELRCGLAYDETPIADMKNRTPRIPDADRIWLSGGFGYNLSEALSVDVGYTHIIIHDSRSDHVYDPTSGAKIEGDYEGDVDILSLQVNWKI